MTKSKRNLLPVFLLLIQFVFVQKIVAQGQQDCLLFRETFSNGGTDNVWVRSTQPIANPFDHYSSSPPTPTSGTYVSPDYVTSQVTISEIASSFNGVQPSTISLNCGSANSSLDNFYVGNSQLGKMVDIKVAYDKVIVNTTTLSTVPVGYWHLVELKNIDWINKRFDVFLDGTQVMSSEPFKTSGILNVDEVVFYSGSSFNGLWDNIEIYGASISLQPSISDITCYGEMNGAIEILPSGGTGTFDYSWSNGSTSSLIQNLGPGTYNVTVTDGNGCSADDQITLSEPATLSISSSITQPASLNNGAIDITISGGTPPYNYSWSNGSIFEDLTGLGGGVYAVTVTDDNGCELRDTFMLDHVTAIEPESDTETFQIYPNPVVGNITLSFGDEAGRFEEVELFDYSGRKLKSVKVSEESVSTGKMKLSLDSLPEGLYLLLVKTDSGIFHSRIKKVQE